MVACYVVPVVRAVRRAVTPRPRGTAAIVGRPRVAAVAGAAAVRRAPRTFMTVCRDAGLGGLLAANVAAAPLPAAPADLTEATEGFFGSQPSEASGFPLGPWGGFPMPAGPLTGTQPPTPSIVTPFVPPGPGTTPNPFPPGPTGEIPGGPGGPGGPGTPPDGGSVNVPEPSSLALFAFGLIAAPLLRRRYARKG